MFALQVEDFDVDDLSLRVEILEGDQGNPRCQDAWHGFARAGGICFARCVRIPAPSPTLGISGKLELVLKHVK